VKQQIDGALTNMKEVIKVTKVTEVIGGAFGQIHVTRADFMMIALVFGMGMALAFDAVMATVMAIGFFIIYIYLY